ncbi:MAG: hypothetical protein EA377_09665 [Phycisphaerales bacterium]|nr:MAG: hypothetical protein EA377_09665 [Phycisphaerales bacterium]
MHDSEEDRKGESSGPDDSAWELERPSKKARQGDEAAEERETDSSSSANAETDDQGMIPLEERADDRARSPVSEALHEGDPCPNCKAPLADPEALVCIRCGFDLKELKQKETALGEEDPDAADEAAGLDDDLAAGAVPQLCSPGRGDLWLPLAVAVGALVVLILAYLSGAPGLFPVHTRVGEGVVSWAARLTAIIQFIILLAILLGCAAGGFILTSYTLPARIGAWRLLGARLLATVISMQLATLLTMPGPRSLEWVVEAILQVVIFALMIVAWFGLPLSVVGLIGGWSLLCLTTLWVTAHAITWTM